MSPCAALELSLTPLHQASCHPEEGVPGRRRTYASCRRCGAAGKLHRSFASL